MKLPMYQVDAFTTKLFRALQISPRGGELQCELRGDRVIIGGAAVEYLKGEIEVGG